MRQRRHTMAGWTALLAAVTLVTASCAHASDPVGKSEPMTEPVPELVWAVGGITEADEAPALSISQRWNDDHPNGPKVRVEPLTNSADYHRQLLALELNAGLTEFDILDLDVAWTAEFARNGWLVDLTELRANIEQKSRPEAVDTAVWDGKLWAAPYVTDVGLLYYNSELLGAEPPTTWDELKRVGLAKGQEHGVAPFVADGAQYEGLVVQYLEYFWGADDNAEVYDTDNRSVLFPCEPALQAATFMRDAYREGFYAPGFNTMGLDEALKTFQSGQAVFMRSWPYAYRQMNEPKPDSTSQVIGKVGIAALPTFDGSAPVTALGGHNIAVSRFSENVSDAIEFVEWVSTDPVVQRELAEKYSLAPTLQQTYHDLRGDPLIAKLKDVLPTAKPRPAISEWTTISEEMQQQIYTAYTGYLDPEPAIDALREFLDATGEECRDDGEAPR